MDMDNKLSDYLKGIVEDNGYANAAAYFNSMLRELFSRLSEDQQKEFLEYYGIILTIR